MNAALDHSGRHILEGEYRNIDVGIARASCKVSWYANSISRKIHPIEVAAIFHQKFGIQL
jgi:hypothetical protein